MGVFDSMIMLTFIMVMVGTHWYLFYSVLSVNNHHFRIDATEFLQPDPLKWYTNREVYPGPGQLNHLLRPWLIGRRT